MGVLSIFLLVLFIIASILLVLLVLVQSEDGDSLGGVFAGGSSSAFGSRSGNILTRASSILGGAFLILSFALAIVNRTPGGSGVEAAGRRDTSVEAADWWKEEALPPGAETDAAPVIETDAETSADAADAQ
jgi:preprotein translocase subunit SecG